MASGSGASGPPLKRLRALRQSQLNFDTGKSLTVSDTNLLSVTIKLFKQAYFDKMYIT